MSATRENDGTLAYYETAFAPRFKELRTSSKRMRRDVTGRVKTETKRMTVKARRSK